MKAAEIMISKHRLFAAGLGILLAAGCGASSSPRDGEEPATTYMNAESQYLDGTLEDLVTFGTHVVQATVVSEQEALAKDSINSAGEGYVGRYVELCIEQVLFQQQEADDLAEKLRLKDWGWTVHEGKRSPVTERGGVRMEVGRTYLVPLTTFNGETIGMSSTATLRVVDGAIQREPDQGGAISTKYNGSDVAVFLRDIGSTPYARDAEPYEDLPPHERVVAVVRDRVKASPQSASHE
jgi:hypothetical protein